MMRVRTDPQERVKSILLVYLCVEFVVNNVVAGRSGAVNLHFAGKNINLLSNTPFYTLPLLFWLFSGMPTDRIHITHLQLCMMLQSSHVSIYTETITVFKNLHCETCAHKRFPFFN